MGEKRTYVKVIKRYQESNIIVEMELMVSMEGSLIFSLKKERPAFFFNKRT